MNSDDRNIEQTKRRQRYSLINWNVCAPLIEQLLQQTASALANKYFGTPFVTSERSARQIQLWSGSHITGVLAVSWSSAGRPVPRKFDAEHGSALVVSQHPVTGSVAVILYPYESGTRRPIEKHIIWDVFPDPIYLTPRRIKRAVRDYLAYGRVSSLIVTPGRLDRWRIAFLSFRGRRYSKGRTPLDLLASHWATVLFGIAIGVLALIYAAIDHYHILELLSRLKH